MKNFIVKKSIMFIILSTFFVAAFSFAQDAQEGEKKGGFLQGLKNLGEKVGDKLNEAVSSGGNTLKGETAKEVSQTVRKVDYSIRDSVDKSGNKYISFQSELSSVLTFVNNDGAVTVCASDEAQKATYLYEYSENLEEKRTLKIQNEFDKLGAFTKDVDGNYYIFFAKSVEENQQNVENMALVKYDKGGDKQKIYKIKANAPYSFIGIKEPFVGGTCRVEISGDMVAVYLAREMFKAQDGLNHQASYGFVLDKNSFNRLDNEAKTGYNANSTGYMSMPYVSHSFNQYILPVDGGFIFADHGDASPRGFGFAYFKNGENTKRIQAFKFTGQIGENATYAEMGGLAKTQTGAYIFVGAYGKDINTPRNLFVLFIDKDFKGCGAPKYITNYGGKDGHAGHPKITALDGGRFLCVWEKYKFSTQHPNIIGQGTSEYLSTYYLIINEKGEAASEIKEIKGVRLNMNDTLRYNSQNGKAYWAINNTGKSIAIYALSIE